MIVLSVEKSLIPFKDVVVLEAPANASARFGTFCGDKLFYVHKGERVRMRIPRDWCARVGDRFKLTSLVMQNQHKFNWQWD